VLEAEGFDSAPFALKLYRHWALHVDLSSPGTTVPFLKQVDSFVDGILSDQRDLAAEHRMFREFVYLDTFRDQLRDFLAKNDLPISICDEKAAARRWRNRSTAERFCGEGDAFLRD
jgi:hypothetical protein